MDWFTVDKAGLAKLLERRGKAFAVLELIQNAWDTRARTVDVKLETLPGIPYSRIEVEDDDPDGFSDMAHAFTLFAESEKKNNPERRGRYNLGEKLVLALCNEATIESTKGTVRFDADGRHQLRAKLDCGSRFCGTIRMTREEHAEAVAVTKTLIPPQDMLTSVNGVVIPHRKVMAEVQVTLPTEVADAEGVLRRSERKTTVQVIDPYPDELPSLYEMGIPVVATGDRWHINVCQKVPLNMDRDNVHPSYLRRLRVAVLNEMAHYLTDDDANETWVRDAGQDPNVTNDAMTKVMDLRFGSRRVAYDPSDIEANNRAAAEGYTVVRGGMLHADEWDNAKRAGAIRPAGQVTPTPKPYSENGKPLKTVPADRWTPGIKRIVQLAADLAHYSLGVDIEVTIANDSTWPFGGTYGDRHLTLNLGRLGYRWFNDPNVKEVMRLLIHEFAHHFESNHLSENYYAACCRVGAEFTALALESPELFNLAAEA